MAKLLSSPLAPLIAFSVIRSAMLVGYLYRGSQVSPLFELISGGFASLLLIYWIIADTRQRHSPSCLDFGFFCAAFFPVSVPWHCFRSRGWRGVFILGALIAILMAPVAVEGIAWTMLYSG